MGQARQRWPIGQGTLRGIRSPRPAALRPTAAPERRTGAVGSWRRGCLRVCEVPPKEAKTTGCLACTSPGDSGGAWHIWTLRDTFYLLKSKPEALKMSKPTSECRTLLVGSSTGSRESRRRQHRQRGRMGRGPAPRGSVRACTSQRRRHTLLTGSRVRRLTLESGSSKENPRTSRLHW